MRRLSWGASGWARLGRVGRFLPTLLIVGQSLIIGNGDTRRIQLGLRFQF